MAGGRRGSCNGVPRGPLFAESSELDGLATLGFEEENQERAYQVSSDARELSTSGCLHMVVNTQGAFFFLNECPKFETEPVKVLQQEYFPYRGAITASGTVFAWKAACIWCSSINGKSAMRVREERYH
eukprot:1156951-Pelagomonas_calceolata.AAC.11